jgi:hypothetical protein
MPPPLDQARLWVLTVVTFFQGPHLENDPAGGTSAGSPSSQGQAPIRRRMMAISSVAAAIATIPFR